MEIYVVVKKLIGPINPVGETNEDNRRFENLSELANLMSSLMDDIYDVSKNSDRQEYSLMRAGKFAEGLIEGLKRP